MGLTQVNTSSHLGQSYHVGRNIVTNWNKSGNIYCKLGKGDSLFVAKAKLFSKVAESSWRVRNKVWSL